ncbi:MAG: Hsp20/alpha crystallin family protein [Eubacteriales bacterium]|nr:Hsp20/alpha crystallin family protein [Eubacteriales bacterium]
MLRPAMYRNSSRDFWNDPFDMFDDMLPAFWGGSQLEKSFSGFKTDVIEKDDKYVLQAELPGFKKEDIKIDLKNDVLTVSASHSDEKKEEDKKQKYLRKERTYTSYSRSFRVENVRPEDVNASYSDGVLEVSFPKRDALPEQEVRKIEVK